MTIRKPNERGMIALIVTILVASLTLIYGLSVAIMTLDELQASSAWLYVARSETQSAACVDNTLSRLANNTSLTGNVNLAVSNVNCISTITNPGGNVRTIVSNATSTDPYGRSIVDRTTVNVNVNTNPFTVILYKDILE